MTTKTTITDKEACLIAKKYVWQEYFSVVGECVYAYDGGSSFAPPDDKPYFTFLMEEVKINGAEVIAREDEQIQVNVHCTALQCEGSSEDAEDEDDEFYEAERVVFCYLEPDEEGNWAVENAEE